MALVTGSAAGTTATSQEIYLEGAPSLYIQDYLAPPMYNPVGTFYWMLTGTSTYNVYEIGCPSDMSFTENLTVNDVLCDNVGIKDTIQQRNSLELQFTIKSFFELPTLRHLLGGGAVTETAPTQMFGFGKINNNQYWHVYAPKVYDEDAGDYIWIWFNKAKFVDAWTINMPFGSPWTATGLKLRAFADTTKPAAQQFGMFGWADASLVT